ncbi:MAG: hypothetical protein NCW75_15285 [Phycisphaera sp.]|nr:MAG: hypothetical protein NCW75_15285 [Phycisphaera sp.]
MSVLIMISTREEDLDLNWKVRNIDFDFICRAILESNPVLTEQQRDRYQDSHLVDLSDPNERDWARSVLTNARRWTVEFAHRRESDTDAPSDSFLEWVIDGFARLEANLNELARRETEPRA